MTYFRWIIFLLLPLQVLQPILAEAATFSINNRQSDLNQNNPQEAAIYNALNDSANAIEAAINNDFLSNVNEVTFLKAVSNASVATNKGLGADYSSHSKTVLLGLNANAGLGLINTSLSDVSNALSNIRNSYPPVGASVQGSLLLGMNGSLLLPGKIGPIDTKRFTLYLNLFKLNLKASDKLRSDFLNLGAHIQYRLIDAPKGNLLWQWGGIEVTTGLEYSNLTVSYSLNFDVSNTSPVSSSSESVTMNWDATLNESVDSVIFTLPVEISTNVRLFYLLSLFTGMGTDLNFGSSGTRGGATGPITSSYTGNFSGNLFSGTGDLNLTSTEKQSPTVADFRFFGGFQLNFWVLKTIAQISYLTSNTYNVLGAIRFVF